jgi:hypothetical protein
MFGKSFHRQRSGRRIEPRTLNEPIAAIERFSRLRVAAPLSMQDSAGPVLRIEQTLPIWAKVTSGTGPYAWTEQIPRAAGTWSDGFMSGTTSADPAYNSLTATLTLPLIVEMKRAADGAWRFTAGSC